MICLLHAWLLEGSGSNLWTRSIITALAKSGETIHLVCQENHPDRYDAIGEAYRHKLSGAVERIFKRDTPYLGNCILHQPEIGDTLPVFVRDKYEEFENVVPMMEMNDADIELYIERNVAVVRRIVAENDVTAIHANHAVLMPVVAERVSRATGIPFTIMPHGSDIEYAVKKDARFKRHASSALIDCARVFTIGKEMRDRMTTVFSDLPNIESKFIELHLGVDTSQFDPASHEKRDDEIALLEKVLDGSPRAAVGEYESKLPDADLEKKLRQVNWRLDPVLLFTGRLISAKGIQHVIEAMPKLLEEVPDLRLIIVGHGPLRAPLQARIRELLIPEDRIIFTGYLTHRELRFLFPCCDVGVFPSMVREAGPLVFLESLASGCFPLGTYFAGMAASIDAVTRDLPAEVGETMKLGVETTTDDLVRQVPRALKIAPKYKEELARIARERYDWVSVARTFRSELESLSETSRRRLSQQP